MSTNVIELIYTLALAFTGGVGAVVALWIIILIRENRRA